MSDHDPRRPRDSWFAPTLSHDAAAGAVPWEASRSATQPPTEVMHAPNDDGTGRDVGRRVGEDQLELFVATGPAEALQRQLDALRPEYIALHDVGAAVSRRLLASVARAGQQRLQRLTIRREGYGTPLAVLEFIEWLGPDRETVPIRLYATEADTDPASAAAIAELLLARSRLGLIFAGDMAPSALADALAPLAQAMAEQRWPNRNLLLLPLGSGGALAQAAATLGRSGVTVRSAPPVSRPAEAWSYLSSTWNRLREQLGPLGRHLPLLSPVGEAPTSATSSTQMPTVPGRFTAPTVPGQLPMPPFPELPTDDLPPRSLQDVLGDYLQRLGALQGVLGSCVFDGGTSGPIALEGPDDFDADLLSREGHVLFDAMSQAAEAFGMTLGLPEMAITLEEYHLLLRPMPKHPEMIVFTLIDRRTNLTLVRLQIQRLDETVD